MSKAIKEGSELNRWLELKKEIDPEFDIENAKRVFEKLLGKAEQYEQENSK